MRIFSILLAASIAFVAAVGGATAQTQRREDDKGNVTYETGTFAESGKLYDRMYALVIGIDKYVHWKSLGAAVSDVQAVKDTLLRLGFEEGNITLKRNLGYADLDAEINRFFTLKGDEPNTLLFFWFAGHGHTIDGEGFIVPADAPKPDDRNFRVLAFPFWKFEGHLRQSRGHHVLAVFDSCFAGTFFSRQRRSGEDLPPTVEQALKNPVRRVIAAGNDNQRVDDGGEFRKAFIEAVTVGSDKARSNRFITGQEVFEHVLTRIDWHTSKSQTPQSNIMRVRTGPSGDIVFRVVPAAMVAPRREPTIKEASTPSQLKRPTVTIPDLMARCRRHGEHPRAAEVVRTIAADLRGKTLTHTWRYGDKRTALLQEPQMPNSVEDIRASGNEIRFRMAKKEGEVVLMPALEKSSPSPTSSGILFEGAWLQDGGYGCVEFRYDREKGQGTGRWWPQRWHSRVWRGRSIDSELAVAAGPR